MIGLESHDDNNNNLNNINRHNFYLYGNSISQLTQIMGRLLRMNLTIKQARQKENNKAPSSLNWEIQARGFNMDNDDNYEDQNETRVAIIPNDY